MVRVSCDTCAEVNVAGRDVVVHMCVTTSALHFSFRCPMCGVRAGRPLDRSVAHRLLKAGARLRSWTMPAELDEPHGGLAFTYDDLIDFHFLLEQEHWTDRIGS
jgi:hypothetical protein